MINTDVLSLNSPDNLFNGTVVYVQFITLYFFVNYFIRSSIAYIGPSLTTYQNLNPGYRIYSVDGNYDKSTYVSIPTFVLKNKQMQTITKLIFSSALDKSIMLN